MAAAYGFDDETELTPDQLVAAIDAIDASEASPEVRNTLTDFLPPLRMVEDRSIEQQIADGDYPNPFLLPGTPIERLSPEQLVERLGDQLREVFNADLVYVALHDTATDMIDFAYYSEGGERRENPSFRYGEGLRLQHWVRP